MTDERLAEIEALAKASQYGSTNWRSTSSNELTVPMLELVVEVRRLRDAKRCELLPNFHSGRQVLEYYLGGEE